VALTRRSSGFREHSQLYKEPKKWLRQPKNYSFTFSTLKTLTNPLSPSPRTSQTPTRPSAISSLPRADYIHPSQIYLLCVMTHHLAPLYSWPTKSIKRWKTRKN